MLNHAANKKMKMLMQYSLPNDSLNRDSKGRRIQPDEPPIIQELLRKLPRNHTLIQILKETVIDNRKTK